ncbi:peroxiredoxin [Rhodocyclaceae bacterium SMB388]
MTKNPFDMSDDPVVPLDDGAADHLAGMCLPDVALQSTDGTVVNLAHLAGAWVIYVYPRTGRPGEPSPDGWNEIPGARGCTPQACSFRDHHAELAELGVRVTGLSAQSSEDQREARDRLHLPFLLLSDASLQLKGAIRMPTFVAAGKELYKRMAIVVVDGRIVKVFYPVFSPARNAEEVLAWLTQNRELIPVGSA